METRDPRCRVVITGLGVVSVLGRNVREFWSSLIAGRSGITRLRLPAPASATWIGGDLSEFELDAHLSGTPSYPAELASKARRLARPTPAAGRLTIPSGLQAYLDAGLHQGSVRPERFAHVMAGHNVNGNFIFENGRTFLEEPEYIDPLYGLVAGDADVLSVISELLDLRGPSFTVGGACASGNLALMAAVDQLRLGRADAVLVTGPANDLDPVSLQGWMILDALSYKSFGADPARASRPFDARREGFVPSQGSAAVVVETLESANARDASIHAEILGVGAASDGTRLTKPDLRGQVRAMQDALADARVRPEQVGYVNAHATSTPLGDAVEVAAVKEVFGPHARRLAMNSTKSMIGHCLTAAAVVEMVATILQLQHGVLHPTINQEFRDPDLDLDFVPNEARERRFSIALSNAFGFGGLNSCVVVGKAP